MPKSKKLAVNPVSDRFFYFFINVPGRGSTVSLFNEGVMGYSWRVGEKPAVGITGKAERP
jgi:hypothetical protein